MSDGTQDRVPMAVVSYNTVGFALAFAAWVMFGPSVRDIAQELGLSESTSTWIKATPILTGSIFRVPIGVFTDRLGARMVFSLLMLLGAAAAFGLSFAGDGTALLVGGFLLGMVGTTFVVGVQSVSSWSPASRQGLALGYFGAGNVGTAITTLGMPLLLAVVDWRTAFQIYGVVLALTGVAYWVVVRNAERSGPPKTVAMLMAPLTDKRTWKFGLYYMATFGVFVAGALTFGDIYIDQYKVSPSVAGILATTFAFTAGLSRIPGGGLSDRFGARPVLIASLTVALLGLLPVALGTPLWLTVVLVFVAAVAMGFGMTATLKYIPDCFPGNVGAVGGMVGTLGGVAGFFLPLLGAWVKASTGLVLLQVLPLAALIGFSLLVLRFGELKSIKTAREPALALKETS